MAELWALNKHGIKGTWGAKGDIKFSLAANPSQVFSYFQIDNSTNEFMYKAIGGVYIVVATRADNQSAFTWLDDVYRVIQVNSHTDSSPGYTWVQENGVQVDFAASLIAIDETKYNALSVGNHTVTMKAKGAGYADSPLSLGAVFNKKE